MTLARTRAVALVGITGQLVEIEADVSTGLPGTFFTGLADTSVVEARERIRAAMQNSGVEWPNRRITLALFPADVRKVGSRFDLALALAVLAAAEAIPVASVAEAVWIGELGLDGRLRPVRGVLPAVVAARSAGVRHVVVAEGNAAEAALVDGIDVRGARDLGQVLHWLRGTGDPPPPVGCGGESPPPPEDLDLADIAGQVIGKRAVELAAAGAHHLYLVGAPGAGKTMLAERLPGLLPALDDAAALEATAVHSVAGALTSTPRLLRRAPFQAPHHTASLAALVGGGSGLAKPGAISLAHNGILFLDEVAEFDVRALDGLRQPLESGRVVLHRGGGVVSYPARFLLVMAANPCPCAKPGVHCDCSSAVRRRYQHRLSGPLLDRIDLRVQVDPVPRVDLLAEPAGRESSATVAARVRAARAASAERWRPVGHRFNATVPGVVLRRRPWRLPMSVLREAEHCLEVGQLSARGFDRVVRMSWSAADLAGRSMPVASDVAEAIFFRTGRSESWAA